MVDSDKLVEVVIDFEKDLIFDFDKEHFDFEKDLIFDFEMVVQEYYFEVDFYYYFALFVDFVYFDWMVAWD